MKPERRLTAILNGDIVGYSRLMAQDEDATIGAVTALRGRTDSTVTEHQGSLVDFIGDNFLAQFSSALASVRCAQAIQTGLEALNASAPVEQQLHLRLGIHLGDVQLVDGRIYGDGVNIAARLQGLAQPGGVCVSGTVLDLVRSRLECRIEDLGEQTVKNIPQPIRVYRLYLAAAHIEPPRPQDLTVGGFGGRAAIAVLPFENLGGDPEQEYFAAGITEDLAARLSACREFPVIASSSTLAYRAASVDPSLVGRELGVRYLVGGSVRKAGSRVRVTAELSDLTTARVLWSERFDRELVDILTLQDEITERVVGRLEDRIRGAESDRAIRLDPGALRAWDLVHRAFWHWWKGTREDNEQARALALAAIERAPDTAHAHMMYSMTHSEELHHGWTLSPKDSLEHAARAAERAVGCDPRLPTPHAQLGHVCSLQGNDDRATSELTHALQIDPSFAIGHMLLGFAHLLAGRVREARDESLAAIRLSPRDSASGVFRLNVALADLMVGRYDHAATWAEASISHKPDYGAAYVVLIVSSILGGREEAAAQTIERFRTLGPSATATTGLLMMVTRNHTLHARLTEGLRLVGFELPESVAGIS